MLHPFDFGKSRTRNLSLKPVAGYNNILFVTDFVPQQHIPDEKFITHIIKHKAHQ